MSVFVTLDKPALIVSVGVGPNSNVKTVRVEGMKPGSTDFEPIVEGPIDSEGNILLPSTPELTVVKITPLTKVDQEIEITLTISIKACSETSKSLALKFHIHIYIFIFRKVLFHAFSTRSDELIT